MGGGCECGQCQGQDDDEDNDGGGYDVGWWGAGLYVVGGVGEGGVCCGDALEAELAEEREEGGGERVDADIFAEE